MTTGGAPRREGPVALSALFDEALRHLESKEPAQGTAPSQDGFLYSGNRHESVPRRLFLDRRRPRWNATPGRCSVCSSTTTA